MAAAAIRMEQPRIHTPPDDLQSFEPAGFQRSSKLCRRHHGARGLIMEAPQITQDRALKEAYPVMPAVGVEVGPELGDDRDPHGERGLERRPPQRPLGSQVDDIGPLHSPTLLKETSRGEPHLELGIPWDGQPTSQHFREALLRWCRVITKPLPGTDHLHMMPLLDQTGNNPGDRCRDAVDLWRVGFRNDSHPE